MFALGDEMAALSRAWVYASVAFVMSACGEDAKVSALQHGDRDGYGADERREEDAVAGVDAPMIAGEACEPQVKVYPVHGRHNHGYDRRADDLASWTCDASSSNSDFVSGTHLGNDVWAPLGTPVLATADGKLTKVGYSNYSGNKVTIIDRCGYRHFFAHLQRIAAGVKNGDAVKAGQVIGYVGKTGSSAHGVVHLHTSIYPANDYDRGVDPWHHQNAVERNTCG